jgi:hypothetical protein
MNKGKSLLAIGFSLLAVLNSCKEDTGNLGVNILPKSDLISAAQTDTTTIITSMYLKDSVQTNATVVSLLGSYNDPVFGVTKASIYAEVSPSSLAACPWVVSGGPHISVDSVILLLPLEGSPYGSLDPQTFVVYRTDSNIIAGEAYYSDTTFKLQNSTSTCNEPIGSEQVLAPNAGIVANDTLRIKLNKNFLTYLKTFVQVPTSNWSTTFNTSIMQGICITTSNPLQLPGQGSMLYVNLDNNFGGIYVYYNYDSATVTPASYAFFPVGANGAYFTQFTHNYATSPINTVHPKGPRDSVPASQLIYVQSTGGASGRINFPNLYKNWSKLGPVAVNEAVLTIPAVVQDISANFQPPANLYLVGTDSTWAELGTQVYGTTFSNNAYSFIITPYIQAVINGKLVDRGMYIVPGNASIESNDVVLYGADHGLLPANKASLTIYYTPLKTAKTQ